MFQSRTHTCNDLRLSNVGNTDYPSLTIYDDVYGGIIADAISLPAGGETVEITHSYPILGFSRNRKTSRLSVHFLPYDGMNSHRNGQHCVGRLG